MRHLVFWQDIPSIHQSALIRALANRIGYRVTLVAASGISSQRLAMGWEMPDFGKATVIVAPNQPTVLDLTNSTRKDSVHIFSGIRASLNIRQALQRDLTDRPWIGIYSESPDPFGLKGLVKRLLYTMSAWRDSRHLDFILAIGDTGANWYKINGYPIEKIFPFGYFLEVASHCESRPTDYRKENSQMNIFFIGTLNQRKGIDLLLHAIAPLKEHGWSMQIIGDGPERQSLEALSNKLGLDRKVIFHGCMKNNAAMCLLEKADLLVLPSHHDGWGAVVSEAIMRGVPVLCSDRCGAAAIIDNDERGEIFTACSVGALSETLGKWLRQGPIPFEQRKRIRDWAKQCISGEVAAEYLCHILDHLNGNASRPSEPWQQPPGKLKGVTRKSCAA